MPKPVSVYFTLEGFDELVNSKGLKALWEQAFMCPCLHPDTKQPDYNCPYCKGTGIAYSPSREIPVVVSSLQGSEDIFKELGIVTPGSCYVTTRSTDILGWRDKLTFTGIRSKFSEVLVWENGKSSRLYKAITNPIALLYKGKYYIPKGVKIEGRVITEVPFKISDGERFSVLYYTHPTYLVSNMTHELRAQITKTKSSEHKETEFPKQAMCTRLDFEYEVHPVERSSESSLDDCDTCSI